MEKLNMMEAISGDKRCPYIEEDHSECYTSSMTSQAVVKAIEYCLKNHEACEVHIMLKEYEQAGKKEIIA
jgi:hypothetical protein